MNVNRTSFRTPLYYFVRYYLNMQHRVLCISTRLKQIQTQSYPCVCYLSALHFTSHRILGSSGIGVWHTQRRNALGLKNKSNPCQFEKLSIWLHYHYSILHGHLFHLDFHEIWGETWQYSSLHALSGLVLLVKTLGFRCEIKKKKAL